MIWGLGLMVAMATAWADPVSPQAQMAVQQHGRARVMVMLDSTAGNRVPSMSATSLPAGGLALAAKQRARRVSQDRDALLSTLPRGGYRVRRSFAQVPALVMDVDAQALQRLRRNPRVLGVDLDRGGTGASVAPDESSVVNGVSLLQPASLDGRGMKVAVIDTGVDSDHPDIAAQLLDEQCFCSLADGDRGCCPNGLTSQSGKGAAEDDNGHGSNVAGIIVGQGRVAPRGAVPAAQLVAVKVLDRQNNFCCSSDVVAALDWLASHHPDVDVVNLSLGSWDLYAGSCDNSRSSTRALKSAVDRLTELGAVVVASAGNQGSANAMSAPACLSNVLGVAAAWDVNAGPATLLGCTEASRAPRQPACFSNRSATTALYAAGAMVTSVGLAGGTSVFGGTSQAAPMVAACQLALKQAAPAATVVQRMDAVRLSYSRVTDIVSGRGYAFLDCPDAVDLLQPGYFSSPRQPIAVRGAQPLIPPRGPRTSGSSVAVGPLLATTATATVQPDALAAIRARTSPPRSSRLLRVRELEP
ncbi:hypothetical protein ABB29_10190 [Pseudoxanthomonas dokdonensis]|uniref:Peptidase S8/S53 domain-containing protein n=2 Tax=Pseudoxanthomonas dokdonensis TaxID=344882 RepID=A0A0R0CSG1_9GAMM|nr:hypothetical protein ABB29_10190 [Pseudoxanthomonas dokdonensis]